MSLRITTAVAALSVVAPSGAAIFTVTNIDNSGTGSLRWAITEANLLSDLDTITFSGSLSGQTIKPATPLPTITAPVTIDGDLNDDGLPDIGLNGALIQFVGGSGLTFNLPIPTSAGPPPGLLPLEFPNLQTPVGCQVIGLAITRFPGCGIQITGGCCHRVRSCHIGVNLAGTVARPNHGHGLCIEHSSSNTIGGSTPEDRNIIACGDGSGLYQGVHLGNSAHNRIVGNYFGVSRDGRHDLGVTGPGTCGMGTMYCLANQIGGTKTGERNVFAGTHTGALLQAESNTTIKGNYFGLGPNGALSIPITGYCLQIGAGSTGIQIGGSTDAARNVFSTEESGYGIQFLSQGTQDNTVQGNLFGSNAAGTKQRPLGWGVMLTSGAGPQTIGGRNADAGNYFTQGLFSGAISVRSGNGTVVRYNRIGILKNGTRIPGHLGVHLYATRAYLRDNLFVQATNGLSAYSPGADARLVRNTFRGCETAVSIENCARGVLGNLGNRSTSDDGGNIFRTTNTWHICNSSIDRLPAEGNSFGTTSKAKIDAKIYDKLDNSVLGRVDFDPLAGGVHPTGSAVSLTSAAALPTRGGAEIAFALSAPADVTVEVLNLAGRVVATPLRQQPTEAGLQRVLWSRRTLRGTPAPPGRYLIRIIGRGGGGEEASALCSLTLY